MIFLQETHWSKAEQAKLGIFALAQVFSSSHTSAKRGVVVLIKNDERKKENEKCFRVKEGKFVFVTVEIEEQNITLINVHIICLEKEQIF